MRKEKGFTPLEKRITNPQGKDFLTGPVRRKFSNGAGFTLIELLVVISVIALLMAILVPTLQRVKRQAKALVCQSNLRQSGTIWAMYTDDNNGYFPGGLRDDEGLSDWYHNTDLPPAPRMWWLNSGSQYWDTGRMPGIRCCPMAAKPVTEALKGVGPTGVIYRGNAIGGTFLAWGRGADERGTYGSYGTNSWIYQGYFRGDNYYPNFWRTPHVRGASNIPVQLDCYSYSSYWFDFDDPPECDAVPTPPYRFDPRCQGGFCINRHDGGINGLFLDWSVRKIGLKELWTLKWHREYDTANHWTKAGGVEPEDWPQWMRKFKDY